MENKTYTYEDFSDIIDTTVRKFKSKWQLNAINWFDFSDVEQIVKIHIYKKWHMWNQDLPLEPWIARITSNQIKNIIRNNYTNYVKPCMQCKFNMGDNTCSWTQSGSQNISCSMYAKWSKQKKAGYGIKLPVALENHIKEIDSRPDTSIHFDSAVDKLNSILKNDLSSQHYIVYMMLFFEEKTEDEVAKFMGYKTNEKNRKAGYKQIKNLKKMLREKAEEIIKNNDIIIEE